MDELLEILEDLHDGVDYETCTTLIDDKILDSFDIVTIVAEVNNVFDVAIPAEELTEENFNSAKSLYALIERLEEIFSYDEEKFKNELSVKERPGDERYIGIINAWHALERDEQQYKIAPKEISMIYKMEKISGALRFLDSLRKIKEIYAEVSDVIKRIIEMNRLIYPQVEAAIPPIEQEIKKLNSELLPLERRLNSCELSFDRIDNKLQIRLKRVFDEEEKTVFRLEDPVFYVVESSSQQSAKERQI